MEEVSISLAGLLPAVVGRLRRWQASDFAARLWQRDRTLWPTDPLWPETDDRLAWLDAPKIARSGIDELAGFAGEILSEDFRHILLLGTEGSNAVSRLLTKRCPEDRIVRN